MSSPSSSLFFFFTFSFLFCLLKGLEDECGLIKGNDIAEKACLITLWVLGRKGICNALKARFLLLKP